MEYRVAVAGTVWALHAEGVSDQVVILGVI